MSLLMERNVYWDLEALVGHHMVRVVEDMVVNHMARGIWLVLKKVNDDVIWMDAIVDWKLEKIEGSLLRVLVGALFVWLLVKYVEYLFVGILGEVIVCVEGKIFGLVLGGTNGGPLDIYLCWSDYVRYCKKTGKILGSSKKSNEGGILVLALVDEDGSSQGTSMFKPDKMKQHANEKRRMIQIQQPTGEVHTQGGTN